MKVLGSAAVGTVYGCGASRAAVDNGTPLHYLSLQEVGRRLASRQISSVELTQVMLDRIAVVDVKLKSYATIMRDEALEAARAADTEIKAGRYRGPLHGVPVAVKDLCYTKGVRTMGGTPVHSAFVPDMDATVVTKLKTAGAVILGKLNLTEGAMAGYHPTFDIPVNPWDGSRWAGVSSSGSGVATAAGLCFGAIGTDTGGSIRFPSAANGLVGLKPTYGRVSRFGVLPLAESLDHVGPMARRVADVAIMFDAMAGVDPRDPTSLDAPPPGLMNALEQGAKGLRLGFDREYALQGVDEGEAASIEDGVKRLAATGAQVVDLKMPSMDGVSDAWFLLCAAEAAKAHQKNFPSRADAYGPYFREFLTLGAAATSDQVARATELRRDFSARLTSVLESVDALVCASGAAPAIKIAREAQYGSMAQLGEALNAGARASAPPRKGDTVFTFPMDLAGTPTVCVPSGFSPDGLPYSIQFAGRRLSEATLCRIAYAYEQATSWHTRHPAV